MCVCVCVHTCMYYKPYTNLVTFLDCSVTAFLSLQDYNGDAKDGRHIPSNITGLTPFHWACAAHHTAAINLLLEHDPRLATIMSNGGLSPLHIAAATGSNELCAALLSNDAPVSVLVYIHVHVQCRVYMYMYMHVHIHVCTCTCMYYSYAYSG